MDEKLLTTFFALTFLLTMTAAAATSEAAVIYVPHNYKTIHEAVKNASPNDTIIVDDGNYTENIVITKSITIKSNNGPDASIVRAAVHSDPVFKISNANEVAIIGFTATGSLLGGIYLYNANNCKIQDNKTISNGSGILVYSSSNNVLINNLSNSNEQYGIYLESSNGNTLDKNTVNSNRDKGVFLNHSSYNNLTNNNVNLNTWNGVILWSSHNNTLKNNRILRNMYGMVLGESNNNILSSNSTWPNIYIILPVVLVYIGIALYLIQKSIIGFIYRG